MKKLIFVGLALSVLLTGCGLEAEAKKGVKSLLNDPDSAQFDGLKKDSSGKNVCGFFNAKNRMGGYVGKTPFYYEGSTATTAIAPAAEDSDFQSLWLGVKSKDFSKEMDSVRHKCKAASDWPAVCGDPYPAQSHALCEVVLANDGGKLYESLKARYEK